MSRVEMGTKVNEKAETMTEVCTVRLGKSLFGVPIAHILEIVGSVRPQMVPQAPAFVGGLVHYRGDMLTTVSLRQLLEMPPLDGPQAGGTQGGGTQAGGTQAILVLESAGGCFGLLVDAVCEVLTVSSANYEPNPSTLDQRRKALFAGAYKLKGTLLVMLDPASVDPARLAVQAA